MVTFLSFISDHVIWVYAGCALVILLALRSILLAMRAQREALFTLEKEAATNRIYRAVTVIIVMGAVAGLAAFVDLSVEPVVRTASEREGTPTMLLMPTPTFTPAPASPTRGSTPTPVRALPTPTQPITLTVSAPTPRPPAPTEPPPAACPDDQPCISSPGTGARLRGSIEIRGTADLEGFQFYKVEYGTGESPEDWNVIGALHHQPVRNGTLLTFETSALADGPYVLRLTVVDATGNFPEPYRVPVVVANGEG